jgi:hypothetical protein
MIYSDFPLYADLCPRDAGQHSRVSWRRNLIHLRVLALLAAVGRAWETRESTLIISVIWREQFSSYGP